MMPTVQEEMRSLFTNIEELRPALVAEFVKMLELGTRSQDEFGRWALAIKEGCNTRILFPDVELPLSDGLWTARFGQLVEARAARNWGVVSQVAYELKLLAPDRAGALSLDDDAFACLDFELPSFSDDVSGFLARAYELTVLYPTRREEISAYDEYLETLVQALGRVPEPNYMDYPWLAAEVRVLYPDAAMTLDDGHTRSATRDCFIDREIARDGGSPMGFATKAAPLKLLAASEIQLTDRGPVALLP
jgi:hypothetical protein